MINYIKLSYQIKRKLSNFSNKITKNISRPKSKFIFQMMYGFLESNSVLLSDIARTLKEDILLKKTIERLSRNLSGFTEANKLNKNYIDSIKPIIDDSTIFCIDGSEITKRNSKVLEDMGLSEMGARVRQMLMVTIF